MREITAEELREILVDEMAKYLTAELCIFKNEDGQFLYVKEFFVKESCNELWEKVRNADGPIKYLAVEDALRDYARSLGLTIKPREDMFLPKDEWDMQEWIRYDATQISFGPFATKEYERQVRNGGFAPRRAGGGSNLGQ